MHEADEKKYQEAHERVVAAFHKVDSLLGNMFGEETKQTKDSSEGVAPALPTKRPAWTQRDWDVGACAAAAHEKKGPEAEDEGPARPWHVLRPAALAKKKTYKEGEPVASKPPPSSQLRRSLTRSQARRDQDMSMMRGIWYVRKPLTTAAHCPNDVSSSHQGYLG